MIARVRVKVDCFDRTVQSAQAVETELVHGPAQNNAKIRESLENMSETVRKMLEVISRQVGFNGLKLLDLQRLARSFRDITKDDSGQDTDDD